MADEGARRLRLGVIGCGAVTRIGYLPALTALGLEPHMLVDTDAGPVRELARAWPGAEVETDWEACIGRIDAAVVALPHSLHARVSSALLSSGIHVLVEKPMAPTVAECKEMTAAAEASGAVLAVGLMRRFLFSTRWLRGVVQSGVLGEIESFDVREGFVYNWPVASGFFFRRESAGGGVLIDTGAHTLDLLLWLLGDLVLNEYLDDAFEGVEADCQVRLSTTAGASGRVELSRTRNLRNTIIVRGRCGEVEVSLHGNAVRARPKRLLAFANEGLRGRNLPPQGFDDLFRREVRDFLDAAVSRGRPAVPGSEGIRSIALIESCYKHRLALMLPWVRVVGPIPNGRLP